MSGALFDMHCHLGFAQDRFDGYAGSDLVAFSGTVTPDEYEGLARLDVPENVILGLGLHPQWIASGECDLESLAKFRELARGTRYISEVGLDFGKKCEGSFELQVQIFAGILEACADAGADAGACGGKLLSIHAVRSATTVLDMMEASGTFPNNSSSNNNNKVIFHWFSGTSDELQRAIGLGAYFSVGSLMLRSKRGREYAKAVPEDRLLLETDLPMEPGARFGVAAHAAALIEALAEIERLRGKPLGKVIARNSARLLG